MRQFTAFIVIVLINVYSISANATFYFSQESDEIFGESILLKYESGVLTTVGPMGYSDVRGIAYDATSDILYGVSRVSNRLITIDPATGGSTEVNAANPYLSDSCSSFFDCGSNTSGIGVDAGGHLFGLGHIGGLSTIDELFNVNETSGVASLIGNTSLDDALTALAFDYATGNLYASGYGGELYSIDPATGGGILLGTIPGVVAGFRIAFDSELSTLVGISHAFYPTNPWITDLFTIDIKTFQTSHIDSFTTSNQIYAFTSGDPALGPVPIPATILLLGLGLAALCVYHRKRLL
ncbi:MAG: hypothetical protein R3E64_12990 [Halioglobus sp.]